jgi:hypothetical protein
MAYVVGANQGASRQNYPPFSWPGGSMIVDFDGRILAQAEAGPGERIVVGPIDVAALRAERERRRGHHMLSQLRTEAYPAYRAPIYPRPPADQPPTVESNERRMREARRKLAGNSAADGHSERSEESP